MRRVETTQAERMIHMRRGKSRIAHLPMVRLQEITVLAVDECEAIKDNLGKMQDLLEVPCDE